MSQPRHGILYGAAAILLWSTSSACVVWAGQKVGVWQMLAVSCLVGAVPQFLYALHQRIPPRRLVLLPPKLLLLILLGFVMYMLLYTAALITAPANQKLSVNLMQYLWPSLIVLLAVLLIPGTRMTAKLFLAVLLALSGILLANFKGAHEIIARQSQTSPLPYLLALGAAFAWAGYSVFLARWKSWAHPYPTTPLGLLITAAISFAVCLATGSWSPMDLSAWISLLFLGLGPEGFGYLFWELAIHRARASVLGLLASATPVLSTLWLLLVYRFIGAPDASPDYALLLLSAVTIGIAVVLGSTRNPEKATALPTEKGEP